MTIAGLLFGNKVKPEIGYLTLDVTLSEVHSWANEVVSNPVEEGIESSDFINKTPDILKLTGMASNSTLGSGLLGDVSIPSDRLGEQYLGGRVSAKYNVVDTLEALYALKEVAIIQVTTLLKVYPSMAITNIDIPRRPEDGDSIIYSVEMKQVRQVTSRFAFVPGIGAVKADSVGTKGDPKAMKGMGLKKPANISVLKGISG